MFAHLRALSLLPIFTMVISTSVAAEKSHNSGPINDIEYSRPDGISLRMDGYTQAGNTAVPAVILVHGGGWVRGDRRYDVQPLFKPLQEAGFAWFSIDYRLATDITRFGVAINDVTAAIDYVRSHASELNVDPERIALIGESAGGQLAAMAALKGGGSANIKAVVVFYAPTDLASLLKNSQYIPAQIRDQVVGTPWEPFILSALTRLSPIDNVRSDMPPFLFIHGTADALVPFAQSVDMCSRMHQAGAFCEVYSVSGAGHGLRWWESGYGPGPAYKSKMTSWLAEQLKLPASQARSPYRPVS